MSLCRCVELRNISGRSLLFIGPGLYNMLATESSPPVLQRYLATLRAPVDYHLSAPHGFPKLIALNIIAC